jgi:hypothetical protein
MRTYFTSILVLLGFLLTDSAWAAPPHLDSPPRVRHEVGNGFVYVPPQPVTPQFNNPGPQISVPQTGNAVEQLSPSLALGSRMRWESNRSGCRERWKDACQFSITGGAAVSSIGHVTTLDGEPAGPWSRTHDWERTPAHPSADLDRYRKSSVAPPVPPLRFEECAPTNFVLRGQLPMPEPLEHSSC